MYVFEPLLTGELPAEQIPNEIRVERGVLFFDEAAQESQLVTPPPGSETPDATATRRATSTPRPRATPTRTATARPSGSATQVRGRLGGTRAEWEAREGDYVSTSVTDSGETMYHYIPAVGDILSVVYSGDRVQQIVVGDQSVYSDAESADLINRVIARHAPSDANCDFDNYTVLGQVVLIDCYSAGLARTVGSGDFTVGLAFIDTTVGIVLQFPT